MTVDIERRIARLEAIEDIRNLMTAYAQVCDNGNDPDEMVKLFTDDAVWDSGPDFGVHSGKDAIHTFFDGIRKRISWAMHYMIAPVVEVGDDLATATGRWYLWQPCTMEVEGQDEAMWLSAFYDVDYRKDEDGWKICGLRLDVQTTSPYSQGWVRERFLGTR